MAGLPPICPVACPNPENTGASGTTGAADFTNAAPASEGFPPIDPVACPNPENPGIPPDIDTGAGAGAASMTSPVKWLKPENPSARTFPAKASSVGGFLPGR